MPWGPVATVLAVVFAAVAARLDLNPPGRRNQWQHRSRGTSPASLMRTRRGGHRPCGGGRATVLRRGRLRHRNRCPLSGDAARPWAALKFERSYARDVCIGIVACLAALAPVHAIQVLLVYSLNMEQGKSGTSDLIKMMTSGEPSILVLAVGDVDGGGRRADLRGDHVPAVAARLARKVGGRSTRLARRLDSVASENDEILPADGDYHE